MTEKELSHDELLEVISQKFKVQDKAAAFLSEHPELYPVLLKSAEKIAPIFGQNTDLELRLVFDPEDATYHRLYCYIWVSIAVDEALDKLDEFDDVFYLDLPNQIVDLLNYNVRYR